MNPRDILKTLPRTDLADWLSSRATSQTRTAMTRRMANLAAMVGAPCYVVGTHAPYSIDAPVVLIDAGTIQVVLHDNYERITATVIASSLVRVAGLVQDMARQVRDVDCYGMPAGLVLGPYVRDPREFTAEFARYEDVLTMLSQYLTAQQWRAMEAEPTEVAA